MEGVEGFAVLDDEEEVVVDLFGVLVFALLEFDENGVEVDGVLDLVVVALD